MQPRADGLIPKKSPVGEPRSVVSVCLCALGTREANAIRPYRPIEEGGGRAQSLTPLGLGTRRANAIRPYPVTDRGRRRAGTEICPSWSWHTWGECHSPLPHER